MRQVRKPARRRFVIYGGVVIVAALMAIVVVVRWEYVTAFVHGDVRWCSTTGEGFDPDMPIC
jgi:hypothetical protein